MLLACLIYHTLPALHMHKKGTRMKQEVIRSGSVLHTATVEVYDFDQQGKQNYVKNM